MQKMPIGKLSGIPRCHVQQGYGSFLYIRSITCERSETNRKPRSGER